MEDRRPRPSTRSRRVLALHQPPSLPIFLIPPARTLTFGIEPQTLPRCKSLHRDYVPQIQRHNVNHQKIDLVLRVRRRTTPRRDAEPPLPHIPRRLHLHPPQTPPRAVIQPRAVILSKAKDLCIFFRSRDAPTQQKSAARRLRRCSLADSYVIYL